MNFNKFLKTFIIFLLVFSWIFSGWPQIWKKPPIPPEVEEIKASPDTLILRPNAAGTYQQWSTFGDTVHWSLTSDQNDNTGVQVTGTTTLKETENLADTTQAGTINSVTAYMRAKASSSTETYTLYAHQETITIAGTTYYLLKTTSADAAGTTFSQSVGSPGRKLFGKWVYQLTDVISIPAATWTVYYRAYTGGGTVNGDIDILIRKSDGTTRTTIATQVASSANWSTSWATYSGTYSFPGYTVVDQTDYLEIDFYANVTASKAGKSAYLRIDDNTLAPENQTRVEGVSLDYPEKAVIVWRTHSTDYESSATTVSRTAFTDYSETRTVNPYTGQAWTWDEVNNLEIGARATQLGSADTIQVSEFWIIVDYTPSIVSVSVSDGAIDYGIMTTNASKSTIELNDMQTATNDGNVTENFNIKGQDATGAGCTWTLASTNGVDQYVHQFCNATDYDCSNPPTNYVALTTTYQTLKTGIPPNGTVKIHLRLITPTQTSCYGQQSVNVTIQAVQP
jgi:hypothetical protein